MGPSTRPSVKLLSSIHPFHTGFLGASSITSFLLGPGVMAVSKQMCPSHER